MEERWVDIPVCAKSKSRPSEEKGQAGSVRMQVSGRKLSLWRGREGDEQNTGRVFPVRATSPPPLDDCCTDRQAGRQTERHRLAQYGALLQRGHPALCAGLSAQAAAPPQQDRRVVCWRHQPSRLCHPLYTWPPPLYTHLVAWGWLVPCAVFVHGERGDRCGRGMVQGVVLLLLPASTGGLTAADTMLPC